MELRNLLALFEQRAVREPDAPAFWFREGKEKLQLSVGELYTMTCLQREKFRHCLGSRVGVLGENSIGWVIQVWAAAASGKTVALLDPLTDSADLISAVRRTDLDTLLISETLPELGEVLRNALPGLKFLPYSAFPERILPESFLRPGTDGESLAAVDCELIHFSSGTTRNSKAVVRTGSSLGSILESLAVLYPYKNGPAISPMPLHHACGFAAMNLCVSLGCELMISTMKDVGRDLRLGGFHMLISVPKLAEHLLDRHQLTPGCGITTAVLGAGKCSQELTRRLGEAGIAVRNDYGSSEMYAVGMNLPGDPPELLTPMPHMHPHIDEDNQLVVETCCHFSGYYGEPEATAQVLCGNFVYMGDAAILDDMGKIHLLGRKKDMIVMPSGEKIYCADVDAALSDLPGVRNGAVFAVGDRLYACLEPIPGCTEAELLQALEVYNRAQPYYRRLRLAYHPEPFPATSMGKLLRRELQEELNKKFSDPAANVN